MRDWEQVKCWRRARRKELLEARIQAGGHQRRRWGAFITHHLTSAIPESVGKTVGFYWPFKGEYDTRPVVRELEKNGARLALPVVVTPRSPMEFWAWQPGIAMVPGVYKIPVPEQRVVVVPDFVLVPLLGFDNAGFRLGFGAGFYDRTLAALLPKPFAVGIGFEISRQPTIFPQPHDMPMDLIVTEAGVERGDATVQATASEIEDP